MGESEQTTLEKILNAAYQEFLQKGFQCASLRSIVRQAGVTTGAFYGYFRSKEELFDALVKEPYTHILQLYRTILDDFQKKSPEVQRTNMADYTRAAMKRMTAYIYDHFDRFKLILCGAEGTAYENLIHDMTQMDCDATCAFAQTMDQNGTPIKRMHPQLEHMLTSSMFYAYFELVVHDIPRENAAEYVEQLISFCEAGWQKIMGF